MSHIRIVHTTTYRYAEPVSFGMHRLVVRPREGHDFQIESHHLSIEPEATVTWHRDLFGNSVAHACFAEGADMLQFRNEVVAFKRDQDSYRHLLPVLPVIYPVMYSQPELPVAVAYMQPVFPNEAEILRGWVRSTLDPKPGVDAVQLAHDMCLWIHDNIAYRRREDRGVQSPVETLQLKSGSCRDMATLLLEGGRAAGFATRFASGYLDSAASAAGRAATHAWTEVYFPDHGWFGYDPTLGENTSHKHITTGVCAHPRGVMPVSGTYSGPGGVYQGLTVAVEITQLSKPM
jgi:transglutaminase-like putative cysteine protease